MKTLILISIMLLTTACVPYTTILADFSAGAIACPSQDIKVTTFDHKWTTRRTEYEAECHGKKFICNKPDNSGYGGYQSNESTCKEII